MDQVVLRTDPSLNRIGHYRANSQVTMLDWLTQHSISSRKESEWLIGFGAIYLDGIRVTSDCLLSPGQYIRVHRDPRRFPVDGIDWLERIIHKHPDFIVVNKPAGIPVHATVDNQIENVVHQLRLAFGPVYITHRLDTDVGGVMVFARTPEFQRRFNRLLMDRKVWKRYRALVTTACDIGRHIHYIAPERRSPKQVSAGPQPNWLECALRVISVNPVREAFAVEIDLETGRTHQIRAQLAALGSPIIGDTAYGSLTPYPGIALFSASITWPDADGSDWSFTALPPFL